MIALHAEGVAGGGTGRRKLPTATVGELEARARTGSPAHVPGAGHRDLLREVQRNCPATQRGGARVGYTHVHLEEGASRIGRRCRTGVRGKCLPVQ